jgi:hypothetical protein
MKKVLIVMFILLTVLLVACQSGSQLVPTPDQVTPSSNGGGIIRLDLNNTNVPSDSAVVVEDKLEQNNS